MKIILGSQSTGRKKVLQEMGYEFEVMPPNIDEKAIRFDDPVKLTLEISHAKADALKHKIIEPAILITSDQVVVYDGKIREKPENEKEAREFLESYNDTFVQTVTSVVVTNTANGKQSDGTDIAKINFLPFSSEEMEMLIKKGDLFKYAGGCSVYGEVWSEHVKSIDGEMESIIGLPKTLTQKLIDEVLN